MSEAQKTVMEIFSGDYKIIREARTYSDLFHFADNKGRMDSVEDLSAAQLCADVYKIAGGFTEEQTGNRSSPPSIARASEEIRIAYLAAQMSIPYAAEAFGVDESAVHAIVDNIHTRADYQRSTDDSKT